MASLSVGISVAALAMVAAAALTLKYVTPVGLTLFAIVLAGILAWRFALKFLVTGLAEGSAKYDAFISYSRQHSEWVVKNVYEPLKAMRKADGSELVVFFDRTEIGLGEAFTAKYMWAIVDSRCLHSRSSPTTTTAGITPETRWIWRTSDRLRRRSSFCRSPTPPNASRRSIRISISSTRRQIRDSSRRSEMLSRAPVAVNSVNDRGTRTDSHRSWQLAWCGMRGSGPPRIDAPTAIGASNETARNRPQV